MFISIYKNREQGQYWEVNNAKMQKLKDYVLGGKNVFNLCMLERGIKKVSKWMHPIYHNVLLKNIIFPSNNYW